MGKMAERWITVPLTGVVAVTLVVAPASADQTSPSEKDLRVSISPGDCFSSKYKVKVRDRQDEWDTQRLRIRGNGVSQTWRKANINISLKPGTYKLTWRTKINWLGLRSLVRERSATVTFHGESTVTRTEPRDFWAYDPVADPGKGLAYFWDALCDGTGTLDLCDSAQERGAQFLGKIMCVTCYSGTDDCFYDRKNSLPQSISRTDPRLYDPQPSGGWRPSGFPYEDTGGWMIDQNLIGSPCRSAYGPGRAFPIGHIPPDVYEGTYAPFYSVYSLPDGNMVKQTETVATDGTWSGTVRVVDRAGNVYTGNARADELTPTAKNVSVDSVRLTQQGSKPPASPRTTSKHFTVRASNNKCATAREGKAIRLGMTLGQVRKIIGSRGYLDVRGSVTVRSWLGCGPDVTIGFVGGRVASIVYT